jgi:hypothetical protein
MGKIHQGLCKSNDIADLDRDKRFRAPARRERVFQALCSYVPLAKPWRKDRMLRLYFPDHSYMFIDETAHIHSSGGLATREFIRTPVHELEKVRPRPPLQPESGIVAGSSVTTDGDLVQE